MPRRECAQVLLAALVAFCVAVLLVGAVAKQDAGHEVSPWVWPLAGFLAVVAVVVYQWHQLWRAWRPPLMLDPDLLPPSFDWDEVRRRMDDQRSRP